MDGLSNLQMADIAGDELRDLDRRAANGQFVGYKSQLTGCRHGPGCFAMQVHRYGDDDRFGLGNPCKVHVNDVVTHRAPLNGSQKCSVGDIPSEVHQLGPVFDQLIDGIEGNGKANVVFAVPVEYRRDRTAFADLDHRSRPFSVSLFDFDGLNHGLNKPAAGGFSKGLTIDLQTANVGKKPMDYVPFWASEYDNFTVSCKSKKPEVSYEGFSAGLDSHHNTFEHPSSYPLALAESFIDMTKKNTFETIEPVGARVLVLKDEPKRQTKGGIALPDAAEIPTITGRIVTISRQVEHDQDMPLRQYDKIIFHPKNAIPVDFEPDNQLYVVPVEDIVAVFRKQTAPPSKSSDQD